MTVQSYDAIVIGGGLHGLSASMQLARKSKRVVLLERSWIGRHASGASAAGVRTLGRDLAEVPLSVDSMEMWHDIESLVGDDCGFHAYGQVRVAETETQLDSLASRADRLRLMGYDHEQIIDAHALRKLLPMVAEHCVGALTVPTDGAADPHRTLAAFRRAAEAAGVVIIEGAGVTAIDRSHASWRVETPLGSFEGEVIVNAAGAWAHRIAAMVGDDIALGTKASMMIVTERVDMVVKPVVSSAGRKLSFKQTDRGTLLIGGGVQGRYDLDTEATFVDLQALASAAKAATELFPAVGPVHITRCWAGIEAKTDDMLPVIGPSPQAPGVFHAFGFSGHGFQLVPVVGATIADLVIRGKTNRPIASFSMERLKKKSAVA